MAKIQILHGPNLNLLGIREPAVYGSKDLQSINEDLIAQGSRLGHKVSCAQSNSEAKLIDLVQEARLDTQFIIINPAAFTHTSIALRDALLAVNLPFIEVHLSNVYKRELFRQKSYFSDIAIGVITGLGEQGYYYALDAAHHHLKVTEKI